MKKMNTKNKVLMLITCLLLATPVSHAKTLTVWAWDNNFNVPIMQEAGHRFANQQSAVEINVIEKAKEDIEDTLWKELSSGQLQNLPDIVLLEDYLAPKYLKNFQDNFVNLADDIDYTKFAQYKTSLMTIGNKKYGIPFDSGVTGLFFRADLFSSIGIRSDAFQYLTWDEFIELGKEFKTKTGLYMLASTPLESGLIRLMLQSGNSWFNDKNNHLTIQNNPALIETLETIRKLYDSGIILETNTWNDWVAAFTEDKVGTVISGVWITGSIQAKLEHANRWMIAPIPRLNVPNAQNASNLGGSSWYVINKPGNSKAAIDFFNATFASDDAFYQKILRKYGALATYLPSQSGSAYTKDYTFFVHQQIYQLFTNWMQSVPNINYGQSTYDINKAIADAFYTKAGTYHDVSVSEVLRNAESSFLRNTP